MAVLERARTFEEEVPIGHVTNGVHMPTWDSTESDDLWTEACGKDCRLGTTKTLEKDMNHIPDAKLLHLRSEATKSLIEYTRKRLSRQLAASGEPSEAIDGAKHLLDPKALTLDFARRIASYKRPNLLLHDPERLIGLLTNPQHPMQLIIAGKAQPADQAGQTLIQEWFHFMRRPEVRPQVIFLGDYDMLLTEHLVQGVDLWINTPRRPWEACGTSGMKVLVNGGLNLSELDGWWTEAYTPEVGWALGDGREHVDDSAWDAVEAAALYDLLEREGIPEFYTRDDKAIPTAWVARMRESMAQLTPKFSSSHAVCQYTDQHYIPAAAAYRERAANKGAVGMRLVNWRHLIEEHRSNLRFGEMKIETDGANLLFQLQVYLSGLEPNFVRLELYADGLNGGEPIRQEMKREPNPEDTKGIIFNYSAKTPATRPAAAYTARVVPCCSGVAVPLEATQILCQR